MARRPNREELVKEFIDTFHGYRPPNSYIDYLEELLNSQIIQARVERIHAPLLLTPRDEEMLSFIKEYKHLQDNKHMAYAAGVMLIRSFGQLLSCGLVIAPEVPYSGYVADIALCHPEYDGAVVVAVEIGDMQIEKAYLPFKDKKLREVWHFPYHRTEGSFIIWSRGKQWRQLEVV